MDIFQTDFTGGLSRISNITLADNQYHLLQNARTRFRKLKPVTLPIKLNDFPIGKIQGLYSFEQKLATIASGSVFIRDYSVTDSSFTRVTNCELDPLVNTVHAVFVPASTMNFKRELSADNSIQYVSTSVNSSQQAIFLQDGVTRPKAVNINNLVGRTLSDYASWTTINREYVPRGRQMLWSGTGILYIVSLDGRRLYRSVSGRPGDFMVVIDVNGDKLEDSAQGGVDAVNHAVDLDEITCIRNLNINDGSVYVATRRNSYIVTPDYTQLIFGEPRTFINTSLFDTGCNNNFSFVNLVGDTAVIDSTGIRSFNAVAQIQNEGSNAPFSKDVEELLEGIAQTHTAAINHNNYALFALNTKLGPAIIVYDTLTQSYTSVDIFDIGLIKQFAEVDTGSKKRLFCYTENNEVYELYPDTTEYATAVLTTKAWLSVGRYIKPGWSVIHWHEATTSGAVNVQVFIDDILAETLTRNIAIGNDMIVLDHTNSPAGITQSFKITWDFPVELQAIYGYSQEEAISSYRQQAILLKSAFLKRL